MKTRLLFVILAVSMVINLPFLLITANFALASDMGPKHASFAITNVFTVKVPEGAQRVHFQATGVVYAAQRQLQWRLNGAPLASGQADAFWFPRPGRFHLSLHDAGGNELDGVEFEVRGSPTNAQR